MSILDLLEHNQTEMTRVAPSNGVILARITNIKDPENLGRVRFRPLTENAEVKESNWAWVMSFMGGKDCGAVFLPMVDDLVLAAFLGGDQHHPVVLGAMSGKEDKPPYGYLDGKNEVRSIKTPAGSEILLDDTKDQEKITITTPGKTSLVLDDGGKTIQLSDKDGKNALSISFESGEISIQAEKKISLTAGSNAKLILDGTGGNLSMEGKSKVNIKGAQIAAEASGTCAIKASGQLELNASGMAVLKGGMVKIN